MKKRKKPVDNRHPPRQIGRIDDKTWQRLKQAAKLSGEPSFTSWALKVLLAAAGRIEKKGS